MAEALIQALHGHCLRALCADMGCHYQGLTIAARRSQQAGRITGRMHKRLATLDCAFSVVRHISSVSSQGMMAELAVALASPGKVVKEVAAEIDEASDVVKEIVSDKVLASETGE